MELAFFFCTISTEAIPTATVSIMARIIIEKARMEPDLFFLFFGFEKLWNDIWFKFLFDKKLAT